MADPIWLGIVGVGALGAGVAAWFGKKNLDQADVLKNPVPFSRLPHNVGRCVATRGRVRMLDDAQFIWCKRTYQRYHQHQKSSGWRTEGVEESGHPFVIEADGQRIEVHDRPNEVYGLISHYEGDGGGGLFTMHGATRVHIETLPVVRELTVCGRLEGGKGGFAIRRDPSLGLLFSPNESRGQATHEAIKGWLGLVGAPLAWLLTSLFSYKYFKPQ